MPKSWSFENRPACHTVSKAFDVSKNTTKHSEPNSRLCAIDSCKLNDAVKDPRSGAQWLNGRVLDSRPKGRGFEPHRRHCVVVLEQDTFILA